MKAFAEFIVVCGIAIIIGSIIAFTVLRLTHTKDTAKMGPSNRSFQTVVEIKKDCSEKVSSLIREKVSDGVLTYGECQEVIDLHTQECGQKDMTELSK